MGTRSTISLEYADGQVDQLYCHWDGYLSNNGKLLAECYTDPFDVQRLMDKGDMSTLGSDTDDCEFYCRDRGEDREDTRARRYKTVEDYFKNYQAEEYNYILRRDGNWYVEFYATQGEFVLLSEAAEIENNYEFN